MLPDTISWCYNAFLIAQKSIKHPQQWNASAVLFLVVNPLITTFNNCCYLFLIFLSNCCTLVSGLPPALTFDGKLNVQCDWDLQAGGGWNKLLYWPINIITHTLQSRAFDTTETSLNECNRENRGKSGNLSPENVLPHRYLCVFWLQLSKSVNIQSTPTAPQDVL